MNNYRYLAVDESNHGQFPEIYVAAFSTNPEDVQIHKRLDLSKIRHKEEKIQNILITSNFKYIVIEKYYKRFFGICGTQIIVLSEFFKAFQRIDTIYLDGQLTKGVASGVKQVLGRKKPNLLGIVKGDRKVQLINYADIIAYHIFQQYISEPNQLEEFKKKYSKNIVEPDLSKYEDIILP